MLQGITSVSLRLEVGVSSASTLWLTELICTELLMDVCVT